MRDRTTYEWVFEELDENGDIVDPLFSDSFKEAKSYRDQMVSNYGYDIALVKYIGNNEDGILDRQYAYIKDEALPATFPDRTKVPVKFRKEVR